MNDPFVINHIRLNYINGDWNHIQSNLKSIINLIL